MSKKTFIRPDAGSEGVSGASLVLNLIISNTSGHWLKIKSYQRNTVKSAVNFQWSLAFSVRLNRDNVLNGIFQTNELSRLRIALKTIRTAGFTVFLL